jgi:hypothetical protein
MPETIERPPDIGARPEQMRRNQTHACGQAVAVVQHNRRRQARGCDLVGSAV